MKKPQTASQDQNVCGVWAVAPHTSTKRTSGVMNGLQTVEITRATSVRTRRTRETRTGRTRGSRCTRPTAGRLARFPWTGGPSGDGPNLFVIPSVCAKRSEARGAVGDLDAGWENGAQ